MNQSTTLARTIVRQLIEAGITDVVLSPGSRNAPLSIACQQAAQQKLITLHVRIDERGAAFFALGIAKATGRAVPIICTSGTAVANYHPAVLEAHHTNSPLLVLTADRPARLRKTGANQTTNQVKIFGSAVRYFADISGAAYPMEIPLHSLLQGPVHLNLQFEEPLLPDDDTNWLANINKVTVTEYSHPKVETFSTSTTKGVLVIGHDRGGLTQGAVQDFARRLQWPVIAEDPLSFPDSIAHASLFLTSEKIRKEVAPHTVLIIGRTTLSRSINSFIASAAREIVIDPRIATVDTDRIADERYIALPELQTVPTDGGYVEKLKKYSSLTSDLLIEGWNEPLIMREIAAHLPDKSALFISSSRPIRDIEGFAQPRFGIDTFANRGLAGIDGNISTALGIATGYERTVAILGDLSFLHDLNALVTHRNDNLTIYVINNDGGGIFSTLPQRGVAGFEEIFGTPHGKSISELALALGVHAIKVSNMSELRAELRQPINGVRVVEIEVKARAVNADYINELYRKIAQL